MDSYSDDKKHVDTKLVGQIAKWKLKAAEHEEAALKARERKEREQARWNNLPAEFLRRLSAVWDWEIAHHDERARVYRQRVDGFARDQLLDSAGERLEAPN
jgi:hypothetical protein